MQFQNWSIVLLEETNLPECYAYSWFFLSLALQFSVKTVFQNVLGQLFLHPLHFSHAACYSTVTLIRYSLHFILHFIRLTLKFLHTLKFIVCDGPFHGFWQMHGVMYLPPQLWREWLFASVCEFM